MVVQRSRRSLHDLYVIGETLDIPVPDEQRENPDVPEMATVWIQKLNPLDHDLTVRKAKAARARRRAVLTDVEGDDYMAIVDHCDTLSTAQRVEVVLAEEETELVASLRAEMQYGEDSEWAKDGYLDGLVDEWQGGLGDRFMLDPDDVDARRVLDELERFESVLAADLKPQLADLRELTAQMDPAELRAKALAELIDRECQLAFIEEFLTAQTWRSTRKPCKRCLEDDGPTSHQSSHTDYFFGSFDEVRSLEPVVVGMLQAAYQRVSVDPIEGKGLRATPDSSESSASSAPEETELSSGPLVAVA